MLVDQDMWAGTLLMGSSARKPTQPLARFERRRWRAVRFPPGGEGVNTGAPFDDGRGRPVRNIRTKVTLRTAAPGGWGSPVELERSTGLSVLVVSVGVGVAQRPVPVGQVGQGEGVLA